MKLLTATGLAAMTSLVLVSTGCQDDPFCFDNCDVPSATAGPGGQGGQGGDGFGGQLFTTTGGTGGTGCQLTNGGTEICDDVDNDCDGEVDEDIDFNDIRTCGICQNNCLSQLLNVDPNTITCTWSGMVGESGTCSFADCAADYHDLDPIHPGCEYYCVESATDDVTCNNKDDDCDGLKDEDVDRCTDTANCGACGVNCSVVHGTGMCASQQTTGCTTANAKCQIAACDDDDMDGLPDWHDLDDPDGPGPLTGYATGCEYHCEVTNGGVEVCGDGIDNDCDGAIDGADSDLSGDPQLGQVCYGDPDGLCAAPSHAGTTACVGQQVVCQGANVLLPDQVPETCNGIDDDCDGVVDDSPTDAGGSCGVSNVFPCTLGTMQCQGAQLVCVGNVDPGLETCNGIDDDCDGIIDSANGNPPADSVGSCNVPPPPPLGATSPCTAGNLACVAGLVTCVGSTGPTSSNDSCGVDANCDGVLTNQPDMSTDVQNCGSCGNDCNSLGGNAVWTCVNGGCQFGGCQPGWYDLDSNQDCEYACIATGSEICDNLDNDCNGTPDDNLTAPAKTQVCNISPAATRPECTTQVSVSCVNGSWQCTFPAGVCSPSCAGATEVCDTLDNDCDGGLNENVPDYGQPCFSDDGLSPPGHGACRTQGTKVCATLTSTMCTATPASCTMLPGGCEEKCDAVDNDCDGLVDEDFTFKGSNASFFVKPEVTRVATNLWVFRHEASRPNATATSAGTGNGYHCAGLGCGSLPTTPPGKTLDETIACSVPGKLPWFNVSPAEVEQTCDAIGGFICDLGEWQQACRATQSCTWGYNPRGAACRSPWTSSKYCNLGSSFDFDPLTSGIQNGLLPTASGSLASCWANWSGLLGNGPTQQVYDITGNLREITKAVSGVYPLMGGAFVTDNEYGASCDFDFYVVDEDFALLDTGFRCCFSSDPTL